MARLTENRTKFIEEQEKRGIKVDPKIKRQNAEARRKWIKKTVRHERFKHD